MRKKYRNYIPIIIIFILFILVIFYGVPQYLTVKNLNINREFLELFIYDNYSISIALYSLLYLSVVALSVPGSGALTIGAGFLFGEVVGTLITIIASCLGAVIFFVSAKMASRDIELKKQPNLVKKMRDGFENRPFSYLFTLRLIPIFPFTAVNLAAAFFQISLKSFILATFLGIIPSSFIYVSLGAILKDLSLQQGLNIHILSNPKIMFIGSALIVLCCLPYLYKHYKIKRNKSRV